MLQNASYMSFYERNKAKQNDYEKKKEVFPSRSRTRDLRRVRITHHPLLRPKIKLIWGRRDKLFKMAQKMQT